MRKLGLVVVCMAFVAFGFGQPAIEQLKRNLKNPQLADSVRIDLSNRLGMELAENNPQEHLVYTQEAYRLSQMIRYRKGLIEALYNFGKYEIVKGDYPKARTYLKQMLSKIQKTDLPHYRTQALYSIGYAFFNQGRLEEAQAAYDSAAVIADSLGLTESQINILFGYGMINIRLENYAKADIYFKKALEKSKQIDNIYYLSLTTGGLGNVRRYEGKYQEAVEYYEAAFLMNQQTGRIRPQALILSNLGLTYEKLNRLEKALVKHFEALKYFEQVDDLNGIAWYWIDVARIYLKMNNLAESEKNLQNGLQIAKKINLRNQTLACYELLAELYEKKKDAVQALYCYKQFKMLNDSIYHTEKTSQIDQLQVKHETEKKEKENQILRKDNDLKQKQVEQQSILFFSVLGLLLSFIIISIILFKNQQIVQKANNLLFEKNKEIESKNSAISDQNAKLQEKQIALIEQRNLLAVQKQKLEEQQYRIDKSIQSAKVIQKAILPSKTKMANLFGEHFVLYKPRDWVSGDFWWADELRGKKYLVVADCTGHGVPGAMMTMIGNTLLNKIIRFENLNDPAQILNQLHREVHAVLQQKETGNSEGMDMGIAIWEKNEDKTASLCYAGAKSVLYFWNHQTQEVHRLDGVRKSVGGFYREQKDFFNKCVLIPHNSIIYMCTDGYMDQNDRTRRRFGERRLYQSLISVGHLPIGEQKQVLDHVIIDFAAELEQRDDILIIGVRV